MAYAVRIFNNGVAVDLGKIRQFWEGITGGQILHHQDDLGKQVFDMIPPPNFRGEKETHEFATGMVALIHEEFGYKAEVVTILEN